MERKRWADDTESDEEEEEKEKEKNLSTINQLEFSLFTCKYKNIKLPIALLIGNISFNCHSNEEISIWLSGQTHSDLQVVRNFKKELFKGSAKVLASSLELAYKILQVSGKQFLGRPLEVKLLDSEPLKQKPAHRSHNSFSIPFSEKKQILTNKINVTHSIKPLLPQRSQKISPFGEAKPVDTLAKDLEFESNHYASREAQAKKLAELDPSIVSLKVKNLTKAKSRRTKSNFAIFNHLKY